MIKNIGTYYLNMPVQEMFGLSEFSSEEYKMCELVGIKRIFKDEKIYHGDNIDFAGAVWDAMLGATGGCVYKISLQRMVTNKEESDRIFQLVHECLFEEMGEHSEYDSSANKYRWDSPEGNVLLSQSFARGIFCVQLFLTSSMINQQSEKMKQAFEGWKTAERVLNIYKNPLNFYPAIISAIMLFLGILRMPYAYYKLLHFAVCGTACYLIYGAMNLKKKGWMSGMGFIALLFNPLVPFHFHKTTWSVIDLGTAVIFLSFLGNTRMPFSLNKK